MARYYKIINPEKLEKASKFLNDVKLQNAINKKIAKEVIPFENVKLFGYTSCGTSFIKGFKPENLDLEYTGFKQKKDGIFYPSNTKIGKEIQKTLNNQQTKDFF